MKTRFSLLLLLLTTVLLTLLIAAGETPARPTADVDVAQGHTAAGSRVVLETMHSELNRAMAELKGTEPAPYFISYLVTESRANVIMSSHGALFNSSSRRARQLDVVVRVGDHKLDNTHNESRFTAVGSAQLPLEEDAAAIARTLWLTTEQQYKRASRTYLQVKTNTAVRAEEEDDSPDFSKEEPHTFTGKGAEPIALERKEWEDRVKRLSGLFNKYPEVHQSMVMLATDLSTEYFVSTEGSRIVTSKPLVRMLVYASTRAQDGMDLLRSETFDATSLAGLPPESEIAAKIEKLAANLTQLRKAPIVEPYSGPALLSGKAAAVFFHEVLGHRLEGQRQRGDDEGQTFTKKLGQKVLPEFLTVVDDPTTRELSGTQLSGAYEYDSEGVPAQRVDLVVDGVLKQFLMSRMPVKNFAKSNGHGRAQPGLMPVARQGNLIVKSSKTVADAKLREMLVAEIKKQGKPYGLYFEEIAGGFTLTTRQLPQAFQILPLVVWRIYADGRPDELVRGVDIIGTPLAALNRLIVTGDSTQVFNGQCGAESGAVPVSASSPAILFSEIEVQRQAQQHNRPPILPPPAHENGSGQGVRK